jgi:hypothetical protein
MGKIANDRSMTAIRSARDFVPYAIAIPAERYTGYKLIVDGDLLRQRGYERCEHRG